MEDDLSTAVKIVRSRLIEGLSLADYLLGLGEGHPEDEHKLEDVVEG